MNKFITHLKQILFKKQIYGQLTIVGVGPGDSSLLTEAAIKAIKTSNIIYYPISGDNKNSYAAEIVRKYMRFKEKIPIIFPMARKQFDSEEIWTESAKLIIESISKGKAVVLICLGDPAIFGSSSYITNLIKKRNPDILIKTVPGISSISAAAAILNFDLLKKGEILKILECPNDQSEFNYLIDKELNNKTVLVLMKIGKRWLWIKDLLIEKEILEKCFVAINIGMKDQIIKKACKIKAHSLPYFSLLFLRN